MSDQPIECHSETSVYDAYPELKGDLLISLWKRIHYFAGNLAEKYGGQFNHVRLEENMPQDYSWCASVILQFGMEDARFRIYAGHGLEAHEALLCLFDAVKRDIPYDMPWREWRTELPIWTPPKQAE